MPHDPFQRCGNIARRLRQLFRLLFQNRAHRIGSRLSAKRRLSRKHLVQDGSERENVGAMVRRLSRAPAPEPCIRPCPLLAPAQYSPEPLAHPRPIAGSSGRVSFARPKSRIFTRPSSVIKIFSGFKIAMHNSFSVCRRQARARPASHSQSLFADR